LYILVYLKGGDGSSVVTESSVSLSVRVPKKETIEDRLEETERQLHMMENKSASSDHENTSWDVDVEEEFTPHAKADQKSASKSRDFEAKSHKDRGDGITKSQHSCAGRELEARAQTMDDWLSLADNHEQPAEVKLDKYKNNNLCEEKKKSTKNDEQSQGRQHYRFSSLLSRKHPKIHV
jgi:hypothetical protein